LWGYPPGAPPAPTTPEQRIAALEAEKGDLRDRMLRIAAEFENWKKRSRKEQSDAESKGREAVLKDVLEVIDNLERAVTAGTTDVQALVQGVNLVLRLFQSKLERNDVRPVEAQGKPFDPRLHDAISQVPSADVAPGTVIKELQRGYRIGERLLRPASVVVAVAPPAGTDGGTKP
jgi:molecular chaperone GrpE